MGLDDLSISKAVLQFKRFCSRFTRHEFSCDSTLEVCIQFRIRSVRQLRINIVNASLLLAIKSMA